MSVYGDMICAFPELMENIDIYKSEPLVSANWSKRDRIKTIRGIIQYVKGGNTTNTNGIVVEEEKPYMWTSAKLENLLFVKRREDEYFRITGNNDWSKEGGFYRYDLQKFNGTNDTMKTDKSIKRTMTEYL